MMLPIRQRLDLWANVHPARLLPGIPCPLAGRRPEDVDMLFVRENSEGEYSGVGGRARPGLFEPVHGSAPDIAGQGIGNPCGAVWSGALMLEHLGEGEAATRVLSALESVCRDGLRTRDVGGSATTSEVGEAIAARVAA